MATAFAVAVRVHNVSHGNSVTAHALIGSRSAPDILMGTLAPVISGLLISTMLRMLSAALRGALEGWFTHRLQTAFTLLFSVAAVSIGLLKQGASNPTQPGRIGPLDATVLLLLIGGAALVTGAVERAERASRPKPSAGLQGWWHELWTSDPVGKVLSGFAGFTALAGLAFVIIPVFSDEPWLPSERIITPAGDVIVGYVIEQSGDTLVVMEASDRLVRRVSASGG